MDSRAASDLALERGRTMRFIEVTPAYGRDYKSAKDAKAAWAEGKDWQVQTFPSDCGCYVNKDDAPKGATIILRFCRLEKVATVKV